MNIISNKDGSINCRIFIASLWVSTILSSLQGDTYRLSDPISLQRIITNSGSINTSPDLLLIMSVIFLIPILLIPSTIIFKYSVIRWLNRIFGVFFGLFHTVYLCSIIVIWKSAGYEIVWASAGFIFSVLIVIYAFKLQKNIDTN